MLVSGHERGGQISHCSIMTDILSIALVIGLCDQATTTPHNMVIYMPFLDQIGTLFVVK